MNKFFRPYQIVLVYYFYHHISICGFNILDGRYQPIHRIFPTSASQTWYMYTFSLDPRMNYLSTKTKHVRIFLKQYVAKSFNKPCIHSYQQQMLNSFSFFDKGTFRWVFLFLSFSECKKEFVAKILWLIRNWKQSLVC